jgi:hypothetical protein
VRIVPVIVIAGSGLQGSFQDKQNKGPPRQLVGVCKEVALTPMPHITITVQEMVPTDQEDVMRL